MKKYRRTEVYEVSDPISNENRGEIARWSGGEIISGLFNNLAIRLFSGAIAEDGDRIACMEDEHAPWFFLLTERQFAYYEPLLEREGDVLDIQSFSEDLKSQLRERRGNAQSEAD